MVWYNRDAKNLINTAFIRFFVLEKYVLFVKKQLILSKNRQLFKHGVFFLGHPIADNQLHFFILLLCYNKQTNGTIVGFVVSDSQLVFFNIVIAVAYTAIYRELNHEITKGVISSLYSILDSFEFDEVRKMHTLRSLRGFVEGFSMLELHGSFGDEISLDESFAYGVDALISGIMKGQENVG